MAGDGALRLAVDNRSGADPGFAAELVSELRAEGFEVEFREPDPGAFFDTTVHLVAAGVAIRALSRLDRGELDRVARIVRESERRRPTRRRFRAVPIYLGESSRTLRWIDVFDLDSL